MESKARINIIKYKSKQERVWNLGPILNGGGWEHKTLKLSMNILIIKCKQFYALRKITVSGGIYIKIKLF